MVCSNKIISHQIFFLNKNKNSYQHKGLESYYNLFQSIYLKYYKIKKIKIKNKKQTNKQPNNYLQELSTWGQSHQRFGEVAGDDARQTKQEENFLVFYILLLANQTDKQYNQIFFFFLNRERERNRLYKDVVVVLDRNRLLLFFITLWKAQLIWSWEYSPMVITNLSPLRATYPR